MLNDFIKLLSNKYIFVTVEPVLFSNILDNLVQYIVTMQVSSRQ